MTNLLESSGFSRSNPYYIVQQGKVNALTMMKDNERLDLLKEVAGTRVYEEKKRESQKIIEDADIRKEKVKEVLSYVEERLNELKEEKDELDKYQKLDRKRRCLEYTLYDKQRKTAVAKLKEVSKEVLQSTVGGILIPFSIDRKISSERSRNCKWCARSSH